MSGNKIFYLICGYKGSGKDTLYKHFIGDKTFSWKILRYKTIPTELLLDETKIPKVARIGLADILKADTIKLLNIPLFNHEQYKDTKLSEVEKIIKCSLPETLNKDLTLRDYYIKIGDAMKKEDIAYWCKRAYEHISDEQYIVVTDFRFKHELEYFEKQGECITIRVFRKEVPIPPINKNDQGDPEHDLDDFKTDLVYIPDIDHEEHLAELIKVFPIYS